MADPIFALERLNLKVDVYGGSDIPTAIREMVLLANRTGLHIWASLNGVMTLARPGDDAMLITEAWSDALKNRWNHASQPRLNAEPTDRQLPKGENR